MIGLQSKARNSHYCRLELFNSSKLSKRHRVLIFARALPV
jgi:hypothetical protein